MTFLLRWFTYCIYGCLGLGLILYAASFARDMAMHFFELSKHQAAGVAGLLGFVATFSGFLAWIVEAVK